MRKLAGFLMAMGLLVGAIMAYFVYAGGPAPWGLEWIVWVGMIKLGIAGSIGLLGAGAFVRRVAIRRERRDALSAGDNPQLRNSDTR